METLLVAFNIDVGFKSSDSTLSLLIDVYIPFFLLESNGMY